MEEDWVRRMAALILPVSFTGRAILFPASPAFAGLDQRLVLLGEREPEFRLPPRGRTKLPGTAATPAFSIEVAGKRGIGHAKPAISVKM